MGDKAVINIIATKCQPDVEAKFNKWYNEVHIPMLFKFKGMKKVSRYQLTSNTDKYPRYLAVYEFRDKEAFEEYEKSPEVDAAKKEMKETWKDGGWEIVWRVKYEVMKTWER